MGNNTYHFLDPMGQNPSGSSVMNTILDNSWFTPELLLRGALNCAIATLETNGDLSPAPSIDPNTLTPLCISNIIVVMSAGLASDCIVGCAGSHERSQQCITPHPSLLQDRDKLKGTSQREYLRQFGNESGSKVVSQYLGLIGK